MEADNRRGFAHEHCVHHVVFDEAPVDYLQAAGGSAFNR